MQLGKIMIDDRLEVEKLMKLMEAALPIQVDCVILYVILHLKT